MAQVISSEEFNNLVEHIEGIAVVDFFATWCGPCKMLAPVFQEVANEFEGKADFYKIDIDDKDKKLLYKTFKSNKKMLRALNVKKKEFKIEIFDAVEEALSHSYR